MIRSNKKKAQSSVEFVLIASIMFLVFIGMYIVIQSRISNAYQEKLYARVEELSNVVETEVRLAHFASSYYSRAFELPLTVGGFNYTINLVQEDELSILAHDMEYVVFLDQNVSGSIHVGKNLILKEQGNISITPLP